jgi:diguanylate cyclase (GGDEF)-like protein/PAS domain S-box-containing protein
MTSFFKRHFLPRFRMTLAKRLAGIQLIFAVVLSLAIGGVCYGFLAALLERDQKNRLRDNVAATSSMTQNFLQSTTQEFDRLLDEEVLDKYIHSYNDLMLHQYLEKMVQFFDFVSYANRWGMEELKIYRDGQDVLLRDLSGTPLFHAATADPNRIHLSRAFNTNAGVDMPSIQLGVFKTNYFDEDLGFVSVQIPLAALDEHLSKLSNEETVRTVVVDPGGRVVYDSRAGWLGRELDASFGQADGFGGKAPVTLRTSFLDCGDCIVSASRVPEYDWMAFNVMRYEDYMAPLQRFKTEVSVIIILVSIAVAVMIVLYTHFTLRPIRMLTETANQIASSGNPDSCVEWTSQDEIGDLASTFNLMLKRLRMTRGELIDERTRTENIISSMADPVVVTDEKNTVVKVNTTVCDLLGQEEGMLVGRDLLDLFVPEPTDLHQAIARESFPGCQLQAVASVIIDKEKQRVDVSVSGAILRDSAGKVFGKVFVAKDITKLKQAHIRLSHLANHDSLTGLPNRQFLEARLVQMLERIPRHDRLVAVLFIDLDRFKLVNDTLGHSAGDRLIKEMAERLRKSVRDDDIVARFGGDEFVVLLNDVASLEDVKRMSEKMLSLFGEPVLLGGTPYTATGSIGISMAPDHGLSPEILMKNADMAMYQAKRKGRNNYQIYSQDMHFDARSVFHLEVAMRRALEKEEYLVYYQPVVDTYSLEIVGVEALIRWRNENGTVSPPIDFLPVAEETGLILPIGRWTLEHSLNQAQKWHGMGYTGVTLAVNISDRQFRDPKFVAFIKGLLKQTGFPPEMLVVELTEGILMQNIDRAETTLLELKRLGMKISVDDFGTGYSSLAHLKRFSLDILKIDRSFVSGLPDNKHDVMLSRAIIGLAHTMGVEVVAEGVETEAQADFLKRHGAEMLQGFLFSKAVPADQVEQMLLQSVLIPSVG